MQRTFGFFGKKIKPVFYSILWLLASCTSAPPPSENTTYPQPDTAQKEEPALPQEAAPALDTTHWFVYLTFDDGPQSGTANCIQICREEQVKASFFMIGLHVDKWRTGKALADTIRSAYPQFLLANHSYSHARNRYRYFYQHSDTAVADFQLAESVIHPHYRIARLPGNNAWRIERIEKSHHLVAPVLLKLDSIGYAVMGWDQEWNFRHTNSRPVQNPDSLAARTMQLLREGKTITPRHLVLLTHDRMFSRPEDSASLRRYIYLLKQQPDVVFQTIDQYPGAAKTTATAAHTF
jgi:peptidoglycan/xylan/chitin deacetylase (PgdA/CDA1 family)